MTYFTPFSSVFIVDFEQVNDSLNMAVFKREGIEANYAEFSECNYKL